MIRERHATFTERFELGQPDGPTVAIKDCIDVAGFPTRCGSGALTGRPVATAHADVVLNILAAGGRIVGKTNMHELAYGVTGINAFFGTPVNPRYPALIPGGSSSGSAVAVAADLVQIAIGSDTGGSIRMPATCCGVYGLKPTFGRVSRKGCEPTLTTLDCIGPLAANIADLERGMGLIDPAFQPEPVPARVSLGQVSTNADAGVRAAVDAALARSGLEIVPADLPLMEDAFQAGITIMAGECWSAFGDLVTDERLGWDVKKRLLAASEVTKDQVMEAATVRAAMIADIDAALENVDALVLPTLPCVPPALDELGDPGAILRLTALVRPFNLSGHPALTIPLDGPGGRPVGLQMVGRRGGDAALCAVARAFLGSQ